MWNAQPEDLRSTGCIKKLKMHLKTYYFKIVLNDIYCLHFSSFYICLSFFLISSTNISFQLFINECFTSYFIIYY